MAQDGVSSVQQNGRCFLAERLDRCAVNEIHALMPLAKPTGSQPVGDGSPAESCRQQLLSNCESPLKRRDPRHLALATPGNLFNLPKRVGDRLSDALSMLSLLNRPVRRP